MATQVNLVQNFTQDTAATGIVAGPVYSPFGIIESALGLGTLRTANDSGLTMEFDAVAEIAATSWEISPILDPKKGIYLEMTLRVSNIGDDATLDMYWGLYAEITDTIRQDSDDSGLTKHARFHMDGNSANILCESDDATTDVSAVDTTIDNVTGTNKVFIIQVDLTGGVKFYIDGSEVLSATTFKVSDTGPFGVFIGMEKTSNDTVAILLLEQVKLRGWTI